MKAFIKHILFFLVLTSLLFVGIYLFFSYNHSFTPAADYSSKDFDQAFYARDYDIIAIGNSKVMVSINKNILEKELGLKTALLAYGSTDISISKLTLEAYLNKALKKPAYVLMEVSWFTFNAKRTQFSNLSGDLFLEDYRLWKHIFKYKPKSAHNLREILYKKIVNQFNTSDTKAPAKKPKQTKNTRKTPTKKYRFDLAKFSKVFPTHTAGIDPILLKDYKAIIALCKENDIPLILFTAPENHEYALAQKDRMQIKNIYNTTVKQDTNILYLDYSFGGTLYKKDYENWLQDSHHIKNSTAFTQMFVKDLKERFNDNATILKK